MSEYIINQLHFITNTEKVLGYITRPGRVHDNPPQEFSLNAVKSMPDDLFLPLSGPILSLSACNVDLSSMNETVRGVFSRGLTVKPEKVTVEEMDEKIEAARRAAHDTAEAGLIDRADSNYRQFGYLSQYDWRFANWGTVADIHSVIPETFRPPTSCLEFTTRWTPPIAAMQELANTFPSVRFKLKYRYDPDDSWMVEDLFAFPPFGY